LTGRQRPFQADTVLLNRVPSTVRAVYTAPTE